MADYFVTVGIDNYHTQDEIYREESKTDETPNPPKINLNIINRDEYEEDFDRVISKLEIFVIKDKSIFS